MDWSAPHPFPLQTSAIAERIYLELGYRDGDQVPNQLTSRLFKAGLHWTEKGGVGNASAAPKRDLSPADFPSLTHEQVQKIERLLDSADANDRGAVKDLKSQLRSLKGSGNTTSSSSSSTTDRLPDDIHDPLRRLLGDDYSKSKAKELYQDVRERDAFRKSVLHFGELHPISPDKFTVNRHRVPAYRIHTAAIEWELSDTRDQGLPFEWVIRVKPETDREQELRITNGKITTWDYGEQLAEQQAADLITVAPDVSWLLETIPGYGPGLRPDLTDEDLRPLSDQSQERLTEALEVVGKTRHETKPRSMSGTVVAEPETGYGRIRTHDWRTLPFEKGEISDSTEAGDFVRFDIGHQYGLPFATDIAHDDDQLDTETITRRDRNGELHTFPKIDNRRAEAEAYRIAYTIRHHWEERLQDERILTKQLDPRDQNYPNRHIGQTIVDPEATLEYAQSPQAYLYSRFVATDENGSSEPKLRRQFEEVCDYDIESYLGNFPQAVDPRDLETELITVAEGTAPWLDLQLPARITNAFAGSDEGIPLRRTVPQPYLQAGIPESVYKTIIDGITTTVQWSVRQLPLRSEEIKPDEIAGVSGVAATVRDLTRSDLTVESIQCHGPTPIYLVAAENAIVGIVDQRFEESENQLTCLVDCHRESWKHDEDDTESGQSTLRHALQISNGQIDDWRVSEAPSQTYRDLSELDTDPFNAYIHEQSACLAAVEQIVGALTSMSPLTHPDRSSSTSEASKGSYTIGGRSSHWATRLRVDLPNEIGNTLARMGDQTSDSELDFERGRSGYLFAPVMDDYWVVGRPQADGTVELYDFDRQGNLTRYGR